MSEDQFKRGVACGVVFMAMIACGAFFIGDSSRQRALGLVRDSLEAVRDTSRRLQLEKGAIAAGLVAEQRRGLQTAQQADALDRALKLERKARAELVGRVAAVATTDTLRPILWPPSTDSLTRRFAFSRRQEPYTIVGHVEVPPAPAPGTVRLTIEQDSVPISFRLHCGEPGADRIRPASITATAPEWFSLRIAAVSQDPDVCNPPASGRSWRASWTTLAGLRERLGVWGGVTIQGRPTVAAGARLWP